MRIVTLAGMLLFALVVGAQARRITPGFIFTATLHSESGSTATMTWHTHRHCSQFNVFSFYCRGRWTCEGAACPGRRGYLVYIFDRLRYDTVMFESRRGPTCFTLVYPSSEPPRSQPPYDWRYWCSLPNTNTQVDAGSVHVEWNLAP